MAKVKSNSVAVSEKNAIGTVVANLAEHLETVLNKPVKVLKNVTLPVLRQRDGVPIAVKFDTKIIQGYKLEGDTSERQPPKLATVIDLQTGELCTLICNAAMVSALERMYPKAEYVGRQFAMVSMKRPHKGERSIREYSILEIEIG